ncbi:MAG: segregation/condensation protein A [Alphaproteobacteria bacterium]|nr:segregation/condensation protein A [Alphaproteobacteria bacterium]
MTIEPPAQDATPFFEEDARPQHDGGEGGSLLLDLDGFEGPIDVLLALARDQKVDLTKISILQLANQYLTFIEQARELRLELAADYLVMAAWLAYLKSRLLLPSTEADGEQLSAAEMAERLAFQLQRLEAMRNLGRALLERPRLNRDFFSRGAPEPLDIVNTPVYELSLYELLKAYGDFKSRDNITALRIDPSELYSMETAIERLRGLVGDVPDWTVLSAFLPKGLRGGLVTRSALAATFAASLELAKAGKLMLQQSACFAPLYIRSADRNDQPDSQTG